MSSRQVLITGGAGFLGVHLTDRFRKAEMRVRLFDFAEPPPWAQEPGVEYMRRDTRNLAEVISSLKGVDSVVHAAFSSPRESLETLHSVNVDGTKNLCAGAIAQGVRRFILISSTIVLRPQRVHPFFRDSPLTRLDMYRATRVEAEEIVTRCGGKGLSVAIVRPKTFIGPSRVSAFEIIFDWVRCGRPVLILGSGQNRYQLLDVRDMAEGIRLIEAAKGEGVFSLGAQEFQTVREDLQMLLEHAKTEARLRFIPRWIACAMVRGIELANMIPLSEWHVMSANGEDSVVDISRALKELGWRPERSNTKALIDSYDWYVTNFMTTGKIASRWPLPLAHRALDKILSIFLP